MPAMRSPRVFSSRLLAKSMIRVMNFSCMARLLRINPDINFGPESFGNAEDDRHERDDGQYGIECEGGRAQCELAFVHPLRTIMTMRSSRMYSDL